MNQTNDENIRITENDLPQEFILKLLGQHEARGLWGIKHTRQPVDFMVKYAKTHELSLPIVQVVITKEGVFMSPIENKLGHETGRNESIKNMVLRQHSEKGFANLRGRSPEGHHPKPDRITRPKNLPPLTNILNNLKEDSSRSKNKRDCFHEKVKEEGKFTFYSNKKIPEKISRPITDLQLLEKFSTFDWRSAGIFFFGIDTISYGVQDLIFTRVFSMIVVLDRHTKNMTGAKTSFVCHAFVCESRSTAKKVTYALAAAFQAYGRSMKCLKEKLIPRKSFRQERPKKFTIELTPASEIAFNDSEA